MEHAHTGKLCSFSIVEYTAKRKPAEAHTLGYLLTFIRFEIWVRFFSVVFLLLWQNKVDFRKEVLDFYLKKSEWRKNYLNE